MKISIITPTFNSEKTIEKTVNSILIQNFDDFEHIIVDNQSNDNSVLLIKDLYSKSKRQENLKIICEEDKGIADAFNKGISAASGQIVTILNSDDYYLCEDLFARVVEIFRDDNILFFHGDIFFSDEVHGSNVRKPLLCPITDAMPYNHPTMFFRKSLYDKFGMFDVAYKYSMDFELICRLEKNIIDFRNKGFYFDVTPIVFMSSGGASYKNELNSIHEVKRALIRYGFWNCRAKRKYFFRLMRIKFKGILSLLKLNSLIKFWRKKKWKD